MGIIKKSLLSELSNVVGHGQQSSYCVAVQGLHDVLFYSLFAAIMTDLRKQLAVNGRLLLVHSISCAVGTGWKQNILRSLPLSWLISSQWARASRRLVGPVGYRSSSLRHPVGDLLDWFRSRRLWNQIRSSKDISSLTVDGVLIGDLVIDSYLRFRPSPAFKVGDPFVHTIIWQALRDIRRARRFFGTVKPNLYLSSYSTYVEHGIPVRVALNCGVPVRVYGNLTVFGKKLALNDVYHTPDTFAYQRDFSALADQAELLAAAERLLNFRLSGGIDIATSYMKVSAYAVSDKEVPGVAGSVIVFLHDFYDSPHVYADLVFPEFWAWITFTIETLKKANIPFWIKPHPNQISLSDAAFAELLRLYPYIQIISPQITNAQLVRAGMKCGVTVYGTVAHELAYMGVPTIACARHPHHAFEFCRTATSREEYESFLQTPGVSVLSKYEMRYQALIFFYMHNINGDVGDLALRMQYAKLFKLADDKTAFSSVMHECLEILRRLPAWQKHIDQLAEDIAQASSSLLEPDGLATAQNIQ